MSEPDPNTPEPGVSFHKPMGAPAEPPPFSQTPRYGDTPPAFGMPHPGPQYGQPYGAPLAAKPKTYLPWAVAATILCCPPVGIVSIVFATRVTSKFAAGDLAGARRASELARRWAIAAAVVGLLLVVYYAASGTSSS